MSSIENHQVFHVGTFGGCCVCFGDIIAYASTHPWTSASTCSLDTSFTDGANRSQSKLATHAATASIATLPSRSASFAPKSCKCDFPQCFQRKSATFRTKDFAKDETEKHLPTNCGC
jgi:hypothetical protein